MTNKLAFWMSEEEYKLITRLTPIPTVNLIILRGKGENQQVLLLVRKTGYARGRWCIIGGRVRVYEKLKDAINRQAKDLGIKVEILSPFNPNLPSFIDDRKNQDKTKFPVSLVYPVKILSGKVKDEGEEYKGYRWFPINNLPEIAYGQKLQICETLKNLMKFTNI